ncbi:hypothetical protein GOV12_07325 [Candidatus Pacearchaeota archaeon]|nr:hypothetical protein [Candidatus Pacearchaeota archaeon]
MKKGVLILALLLSINLISAIEINLNKQEFSPFETLQVEITGNFITLSRDNIMIYRNGIPRPNPVIYDFIKFNNIFYYYALLPNEEGNYSLIIENSKYTKEGKITSTPIIKDFKIMKSNKTKDSLLIYPGFIVTSTDFQITIKSTYQNQEVTITGLDNNTNTISLIEDQEKLIDFSINEANKGKSIIKIGNYDIPIFILNKSQNIENKELRFYPNSIDAVVTSGTKYFFTVILENIGNTNISNIELTNNLGAQINPIKIDLIEKYSSVLFNISIPVNKDLKNNLSGIISANYGDKSAELDVSLKITNNESQVDLNGTTVTPDLSCAKIGMICVYPEKCIGEKTQSLEGPCCKGECKVDEVNNQSYNWVYGIGALVIVIIIAILVVKKRKKPKTSEEILGEKNKKFETRMKNPFKPSKDTEVRNNLGRT